MLGGMSVKQLIYTSHSQFTYRTIFRSAPREIDEALAAHTPTPKSLFTNNVAFRAKGGCAELCFFLIVAFPRGDLACSDAFSPWLLHHAAVRR
eukprot:352836-Chlamydomonas_euryale.AAC.8